MGVKLRKIYFPSYSLLFIGLLFEIFNRCSTKASIINYSKTKQAIEPFWLCSNKLARDTIGFKQKYSLQEALKITYDWYVKTGWL